MPRGVEGGAASRSICLPLSMSKDVTTLFFFVIDYDCRRPLGEEPAPAIKHLQTCARDKMRLVQTVCRASVALHFYLAEMG